LHATSDNTPVALTVGEQTVVGRATGGNIAALAIDSDLSSVSANDDTIPSAKATKAMGDLKLPLAGGTMTGDITLGDNTGILIPNTLTADTKYSGTTMTGTAGENVAFGNVCYMKSDGKLWKADANGTGTYPAKVIALGTISADASGTFLVLGKVRNDAWNWTIGGNIYLSTTAGDMTQTAPSATDEVIQVLGTAFPNADTILFNPSGDYITHT